jgi:hypothetical protein
MISPLVQHLLVTTTANFGPRGNPVEVVQYSYYIGDHGPFTDQFPKGTDTVDAVTAKMQENIDKLVAVGAIPAQS